MIRVITISLILLLFACNSNKISNTDIQPIDTTVGQHVNTRAGLASDDTTLRQPLVTDTAALAHLHDSLFQLAEVQRIHKQILAATGNKHGVSMIDYPISGRAGKYEIAVGYSGNFKFERKLSFFVDVKTMEITVEDNSTGNELSLDDFHRKSQAGDKDTTIMKRQ